MSNDKAQISNEIQMTNVKCEAEKFGIKDFALI
jgi:hypothetical protein